MMIDRRSVRDIGLAVLLALPTAALTRPATPESPTIRSTPQNQLVVAERSPLHQRFNLPG